MQVSAPSVALPAHVAPPPGPAAGGMPHNVIPIRGRSSQLLRTGTFQGRPVDPYQDFLAGLSDIDPKSNPGLWSGLVPDPSDPAIASMIERPTALHEHTEAREDPVADAWGGRSSAPMTSVAQLVVTPGSGGGSGG